MKILSMDTALDACSVAIMEDETTIAFHHEVRKRGHAEMLIPIIKNLMTENGLSFSDLDLIAVTIGPGTFTGLRIGLAAARGFSVASGIPCIGVTTLETLATQTASQLTEPLNIVPLIDARRQEVYVQRFSTVKTPSVTIKALSEPSACPLQNIHAELGSDPAILIGSGVPLLREKELIDPRVHQIIEVDPNPDARVIASIARLKAGSNLDPSTSPDPLYLRAPDAKLPGGKDPK
ncbi:tRNA (adenosine(37)-N6)-threonylcarbamoyltransferase complex dimerization subunit type 1 TsaB [Sneathiella limimaris]|uniref:tRNA (adenosine(37)-N6)-threonylcarbamoyltransferase complex dimerization subunit type 1 TsaB n=1 Tax=Sneathiella limimaris TaxID=1964213 RepID=UPI00146A2416|nr:tRNA (adenosine(37)-N6)-threonylcarbamoyltransferase complex dimerization subunit type 1 TsaB [Sneathiella limimaris]